MFKILLDDGPVGEDPFLLPETLVMKRHNLFFKLPTKYMEGEEQLSRVAFHLKSTN